jgi:DNA-binding response OmpR family regulator
MRILLVEDEVRLARSYQRNLQDEAYIVETAFDGDAAYARVMDAPDDFDVVILDVMLPKRDGITVCRDLRKAGVKLPILLLTALDQTEDKVAGLDAGADDYLTKPFRLTELLARLRAHLRRLPAPAEQTLIEVGRLRLDLLSRRAYLGTVELPLRPKEFDLLAVLSATPGKVHSRGDLMASVWDEHWYGPTKTLDVHVSSLRRKLTKGGEPAPCIETIRGRGYRFEPRSAG